MRLNELKPKFVTTLKQPLEEGILYISLEYRVAIHLCACGCGEQTVTPLNDETNKNEWDLTVNGLWYNAKITLRPSIGNFTREQPNYHAHYYITENKIEWL